MVLLTYVMIVAYVIKAIAYVLYSKKDAKKQRKCIRDMSSFSDADAPQARRKDMACLRSISITWSQATEQKKSKIDPF